VKIHETLLSNSMTNIVKKKVAFHTLGCKLNFAETSTISRSFPPDKFERVPASAKADIYVINTCSVTDAADKKCRQAIRKFISLSPDAFIAVVGCYAQLKPQEISSIPGVDLVLGTNEKFNLSDYVAGYNKKTGAEIHSCELTSSDSFNMAHSMDDRTRSFLKIQDGCDYGCSYCTIPMARGRSRNPDKQSLLEEARKIAEIGVKEIVLTGVNIGDFGRSTGETIVDLLRVLVDVEGIERYRISSIEPNLLTEELIDLAAENPKILPHFHIPLQSGNNKILGLMRRRYSRELFASRVRMIMSKIPLSGIGADVIVGFPGESTDDFENTFTFLEEMPLSYLHIFTYSERPGTVAEKLPAKVNHTEKVVRSKRLTALSKKKSREFYLSNTGQVTNVLFERTRSSGLISGFTPNYIRVEYPWQSDLAGRILRVQIKNMAQSGKMNIELIQNT
jgi:threonylcarbamoyladenosine tRNA methylthiotransferase MtaB